MIRPAFLDPKRVQFARGWGGILALALGLATAVAEPGSIEVEIFDTGFLEGDCNYHSITAASNGWIYFTVGTHQPQTSAKIFRFDPNDSVMEEVADVSAVLGVDPTREVPHGKIHTPLFEHEGWLYFATHTSVYDGSLPDTSPADGRTPYAGGHFMRLSLQSNKVEDLAGVGLPNEGLITMAMGGEGRWLYGLTWPSGLLIGYDRETEQLRSWGAVQDRGEWGHLGSTWDFICRKLGVDDAGLIYGSDREGRIWQMDPADPRPIRYMERLDLDRVPPLQDEDFVIEPEPHYYWRNWRTILWNEATTSFWGLHGGSSQLFEFSPSEQTLRSVRPLVPASVNPDPRNPWRTQLGFALGADQTLYYLAHSEPEEIVGRRPVRASVNLLSYAIEADELIEHGTLVGPSGERVFFTESLEIAPNGDLYTVAWVETLDPARMEVVQAARGAAAPDETTETIYEIKLVRISSDDF